MRKKIIYLFMLGFLAVTFSCATSKSDGHTNKNIHRFVSNNIFYSTSNPSIEITINPEFKYLGKAKNIRNVIYTQGSDKGTVEDTSFIFIKDRKNHKIKKGIVISISTTEQGYIWPNLFAGMETYLDSGSVKITGRNYQYNIRASSTMLRDYEIGFIVDN